MAANRPKLMARNAGVIEIPASATQQRSGTASTGPSSAFRLKLVIRRLPPGLSEMEFQTALGDEWNVGNGKVDWAAYKPGKVSKDLSKPSRPSRAYINVMKQEYISLLADKVRSTRFHDANGTSKDPVLLGPPSLDYAPYGRIPHSRIRKDARQGTIDQDQEFIDFLESLTNPVSRPTTVDQRTGPESKAKEKVKTTPLIQFIKDKKANKAKEGTTTTPKAVKHARQTSKDTVASPAGNTDKKSPAKVIAPTVQPEKRSAQAIMVEKAARDAARVPSKQALTPNKTPAPSGASASPIAPPIAAPASPLAEKKRERGSASAAANILRRDLGIGNTPGGRGGRRGLPPMQGKNTPTNVSQNTPATSAQSNDPKTVGDATNNATPDVSSETTKSPAAPSAPAAASTQPSPTPQPPTGPSASRGSRSGVPPSAASTSNAPSPPVKPHPATAASTPSTATQAFLKHANPSQGITEPLLKEAFTAFGAVKSVEIDRKKGSAYVDFEEPDGLQKAIKASPVKVAQGQVVVLERRLGPQVRGGSVRGGAMMGNRGVADARGGMLNHRGRGGIVSNRGGGVPMGPTGMRGGGGVRGRGGFVRGGAANLPHTAAINNTRPVSGASSTAHNTGSNDPPAPIATTADHGKAEAAALPPSSDTAPAIEMEKSTPVSPGEIPAGIE
ncbi:MAG: hypothetical protein Q9222_006827 [Ikaeria aurantiellina]